jgi:uncharacterized protein (DUF427 family)
MAIRIADNAKTQRYSPCNTMETLLVHADIAARVLPPLCDVYTRKKVELRGCERSRAIVPAMKAATDEDWYAEYLAPILAGQGRRLARRGDRPHREYGSQHTDAIVTQDHGNAMRFLREVDSSSVLVNARRASPTASNTGSARRSASRPTSCTRAGRSGSKASPAASGSCSAPGRSAPIGRHAMKATWNGTLLAASDATIVVEGNHYFPPDSVRREHFRESADAHVCPWKGLASYYDVIVGDAVNRDAAWYYPVPKDAASRSAVRVAFWKGVKVEA